MIPTETAKSVTPLVEGLFSAQYELNSYCVLQYLGSAYFYCAAIIDGNKCHVLDFSA